MNFLSVLYAKAGITVDGITTLNNTATALTPTTSDNSTKIATTAFVKNQNYYPYPTGTTSQYVRGDGSLATFPTIAPAAQKLVTEVYNETGATLTKGTIVYINGGHGNLPTITKALASSDATSAQTYGVVQNDITDQNNGYVVVIGSLIDLNTNSYLPGTILYLSGTTAGEWTSTKPYAPIHLVYIGIVTRQHPTQGVVEIRIQNGYEMDELHNVSAQSPANGDILQFNFSTQLWTKTAGTTTNIAEGTNLYFTDARARAAITLTTTGTSGAATYSGGVLNIPQYQAALTNPVTGTGTTNYITKWTSSSAVGNSALFESTSYIQSSKRIEADDAGYSLVAFSSAGNRQVNIGVYGGEPTIQGTLLNGTARQLVLNPQGGNVGIAISNPTYPLDVNGDIFGRGNIRIGGSNIFYFETFNGGWYMQDTTWIRSYASKSLWMDSGKLGADGGLTIGYGGAAPSTGGAIIAGNVGIGTNSATAPLDVNGSIRVRGNNQIYFDTTGGTNSNYIGVINNYWLSLYCGRGNTSRIDLTNGSGILFSDNGSEMMRVASVSGNLLIGTTTDNGFKLQVNGGIFNNGGIYVNALSYTGANITIKETVSYPAAIAMINRNGGQTWGFAVDTGVVDDANFGLYNITAGSFPMVVSTSGVATFSSSVTANSSVQSQVIGSDGTYGSTYPMYSFTGISNGYHRIFAGTGDDMYFAAATSRGFQFRPNGSSTSTFVITSVGNVGIGTTTPASITNYKTLTLDATDGSFTEYRQNGTALFRVGADGSRPFFVGITNANMDFYTNSTLRMTIAAGGNVGINTSSPSASAKLHIVADSSTASIFLDAYGTRAGFLGRVATGTIGSPGYITLNYNMGAFGVRPWNGTDFYTGGNTYISFVASEAHALNSLGGRIVFQTTANGTAAGVERMRIENNGNVLIGTTTDEGYKLYVNGGGLFNGVVTSYATMDHYARRINSPEGATYVTTTSSITGAIKIKLPIARNNSGTMMMFTVNIYQYNTGNSHKLQISGYNYSGGGWYNPSVTDLSDNGVNFNVRFGNDGISDCVWIGETSSGWVYPQVFVTDFQAGYSGQGIEWATGWAISFETSFDTVEETRLAAQAITTRSIGAQSVNYAVSAGNAATINSNPNRTDSAIYPVVWSNGNAQSPNYSCADVNIQSSTGTLKANILRAQKSQTSGDYTTAAIWTESYSTTTTGIAFHISGTVGKFLEMRTNGILYWEGNPVITTGNISSYAAAVDHTHNLGRYSLQSGYIDSLTSTTFRTTLFGVNDNSWNISTARWNSVPTALSGMNMYGTLFSWSGADTQGFIAVDYSASNAQIGGGSGNNINWKATLITSSNYSSYALPISGGTLTGNLILPNSYDLSWGGTYGASKPTISASDGVGIRFYPDGASSGATLTIASSGNVQIGTTTDAGYKLDVNGATRATDFYTDGWFRNSSANKGLYNSSYNTHLYSRSGGIWSIASSNSSLGYLEFWYRYYDEPAAEIKGSIVWNSEGFGLLNNQQSDFSVLCNQGTSYGGTLRGDWNITGANLSINSEGTFTYSNITYSSSLDPGPYNWYSGVAYDGVADETYYYIYYSDGNQFRLYVDGTIYINGGAFSQYTATSNYISVGAYGLYSSTYSAYFRRNDASSYAPWELVGAKGGYTGMYYSASNQPHIMFNTSNGYGGLYYQTGSRWVLYYDYGNNCLGVGQATTSASYKLYVTGAIYATGAIVANSDGRNKENVEVVENALDKVNSLRGVTYTKKDQDSGKREMGVIAQEVLPHVPEVIQYAEDLDQYGVSYGNFAGLFIEAIKEQQVLINELKAKIEILENK